MQYLNQSIIQPSLPIRRNFTMASWSLIEVHVFQENLKWRISSNFVMYQRTTQTLKHLWRNFASIHFLFEFQKEKACHVFQPMCVTLYIFHWKLECNILIKGSLNLLCPSGEISPGLLKVLLKYMYNVYNLRKIWNVHPSYENMVGLHNCMQIQNSFQKSFKL